MKQLVGSLFITILGGIWIFYSFQIGDFIGNINIQIQKAIGNRRELGKLFIYPFRVMSVFMSGTLFIMGIRGLVRYFFGM